MIAMTAAARQAKPANAKRERGWLAADTPLSARSTALFMSYEFIDTFNVIQTARHVGVNKML